uniref:Gamma-glutamylcysteine synthetase n=1 Tax=Haemonchus contortus TaxID=6289 RepID=A0A7I4YT31_HAECO
MPLFLTLIDLKKTSVTVETEAVIEDLGNQGVPSQYLRMLRELYNNFTTSISPFYEEVITTLARQGDTISPELLCRSRERYASYGMGKHGSS